MWNEDGLGVVVVVRFAAGVKSKLGRFVWTPPNDTDG